MLKTIANGCKIHFNLHAASECPGAECRNRAADHMPNSGTGGAMRVSLHWVWSPLQWLALAVGVASRMWLDEGEFAPGRLAIAAITATMIFPAVYRKTMADSESHFLKLCVTFAAGHGYKSLIDAAA